VYPAERDGAGHRPGSPDSDDSPAFVGFDVDVVDLEGHDVVGEGGEQCVSLDGEDHLIPSQVEEDGHYGRQRLDAECYPAQRLGTEQPPALIDVHGNDGTLVGEHPVSI